MTTDLDRHNGIYHLAATSLDREGVDLDLIHLHRVEPIQCLRRSLLLPPSIRRNGQFDRPVTQLSWTYAGVTPLASKMLAELWRRLCSVNVSRNFAAFKTRSMARRMFA